MKAKKSSSSSKKKSSTPRSPRMSVSPQSLARTRYKRSLKVPARFNDTEYAFRDVADALRMKGKTTPSESSRQNSSSSSSSSTYSSSSSTSTTPSTTPAPTAQSVVEAQAQAAAAATSDSTTIAREAAKIDPIKRQPEGVDDQMEVVNVSGGAFHPSVTIKRSKVRFDDDSGVTPIVTVRPLVEQVPNSLTAPANKPQNFEKNQRHNSSTRDTPKKKSKGYSLMLKQQQQQQQQPHQDTSLQQNHAVSVNNVTIQPTISTSTAQIIQQQTRPLNGAQFGTRILLNEPIYLPRSVGNIAPITATLPQIANLSRRPPFVSKKTEKYLEYQETRKLDYITSHFKVLTRITKYLGVGDLINLSLVSRTWNAIITSPFVWKKVSFTSQDSTIKWKPLCRNFLSKFDTRYIIFDGYVPSDDVDIPPQELGKYLQLNVPSIKRVWIKSSTCVQNTVAYDLINSFMEAQKGVHENHGKICWQVKAAVDDSGIATAEVLDGKHATDPDIDNMTTKSLCLYDLEKDYNRQFHEGGISGCTGSSFDVEIQPV